MVVRGVCEMNTSRPGRSVKSEESAKISFSGPLMGALDEEFYQKEAQWNDSDAQICVECDVIWLQVNQ